MKQLTLPITGRCLCGGVHYSVNQQPKRTGLCHCRACQIRSGSAFITLMVFDKSAVTIDGKVKWYESTGGSGNPVRRGFCPRCASNLFGNPTLWPDIFVVYAGSLDHPEQFEPEVNIWLKEAPAWLCINHDLPGFDENP